MESYDSAYGTLLLVTVLVPLGASFFILANPRNSLNRVVGLAASCFPVLAALFLWFQFSPDPLTGYAHTFRADTGLQALGIHLTLGLNGISLPLFLMAAIVGLASTVYAMVSGLPRLRTYLILLLMMQSGLLGLFASIDLFFFYFFHELALIPTFLAIGIWGGRDRHSAAMEITIYLTLGAMLSLIGLIALVLTAGLGTFDMLALRQAVASGALSLDNQTVIFGLLLIGFGILVSLWPLHTWAPRGYYAAPTSFAMLHAGVLKKFGLYGLLQVAFPLLPEGASQWTGILTWLALGSVLIIGWVTVSQRDLKQMVGYSSVMHMGYAFLGLATLSTLGASGVVLFMVAHGYAVAMMFMASHCVHRRTLTFDMDAMGGLYRHTPVLAFFFGFAMFAGIALPGPGLLNFWAEFTLFLAIWEWQPWVVIAAAVGVIISAIYGLRALAAIFFGPEPEGLTQHFEKEKPIDLKPAERLAFVILAVPLLVFGFWPRSITEPMQENFALFPPHQELIPAIEAVLDNHSPATLETETANLPER